MKRLWLIIIFLFAGIVGINAQDTCPAGSQSVCEPGSVCVRQQVLDRCADTVDKLKAARDVIAKFESERTMTEAERAAAQTLIKGLNDYLAVKDRIIADYEQISKMKDGVIAMYQSLVEKLTAQINKKQSSFSKFIQVLEKVALLVLGITVGRGL